MIGAMGEADVVEQLLISLFAGGHCLITGAPGLAKTLLVRSIAQIFHLKFQRIQFTPDLMPADLIGTNVFDARSQDFVFREGPLFADLLLADEVHGDLRFEGEAPESLLADAELEKAALKEISKGKW